MSYYININGQAYGPMTAEQLFDTYNPAPTASISEDTTSWKALVDYPELMEIFNKKNQPAEAKKEVNKTTFAILAWLLGAFGGQWWYAGKKTQALYAMGLYLGVTILTCGFGSVICILNLVMAIKVFTASDEEFKAKYLDNEKKLILI